MKKLLSTALAALVLSAIPANAINVYPIDKAQILAGAQFDFKVELDGVVPAASVEVTINGGKVASVLGKDAALVTEKDKAGAEASALWLRDVKVGKAGDYKVVVKVGTVTKTVNWTVYPAAPKAVAKNVIFLIADGLSVGHRTAARILSKGNTEGTSNGLLAMDNMDRTGAVGTSSVDSLAVDSANSMSAYMTGHKTSVNALGVYADRTPDPFDDPKQETLGELVRRTTKKSIGVVSDAELQDATPAAVVAHSRLRDKKAEIMEGFWKVKPEVILGGGSAYFLPQSVAGSKRTDDKDYFAMFEKDGYKVATTNSELSAVTMNETPKKLLGVFHPGNLDGSLDRLLLGKGTASKYNDQPDLTNLTRTALEVLSTNKEGFVLVVEAGLVDKYSHPMDWERAVYDTIMFDKVIAIAQDFAKKNPDTLVVVTGDHTHSISVYGTVDDKLPGPLMRDKVRTYAGAGFTNYVDANGDGYPDSPNPSKRLAVGWANHPDYWETFTPKLDAPFNPTVQDENKNWIANDKYKSATATLIAGNLARTDSTEVHSIDDMTLMMSGPGSDKVKGYQENTAAFRYLVEALGLKP